MHRQVNFKKIHPGRLFRSPWFSLAVSIVSLFMLYRYIRIFTTAEDPGAHLAVLMLWAILAIMGIVTFICQIIPNNK